MSDTETKTDTTSRCGRRLISSPFCFYALLFAIQVFMIAFANQYEGWDICASIYYVTQLITTVGYGDITPQRDGTRLALAFYILFCLIVLANLLNKGVAYLQSQAEQGILRTLKAGQGLENRCLPRKCKCLGWARRSKLSGEARSLVHATLMFAACILFGTLFYRLQENCSCSYNIWYKQGCIDGSFEDCRASGGQVKDWIRAFYMSVVTLTTVGLGDFTPLSIAGRWVAIPWMVIGVSTTGYWISSITAFCFKNDQEEKKVQAQVSAEQLIQKLDDDHDGCLTQSQHHLYMLVMNGVLSEEMLNELNQHFLHLSDGRSLVSAAKLTETDTQGKADEEVALNIEATAPSSVNQTSPEVKLNVHATHRADSEMKTTL